jgi:ligand-binding SRPBCC domain-containing protein
MAILKFSTSIKAPLEICFNLARSIELHEISTGGSDEKAVAGITSGCIGLGEFVTWEATHFGLRLRLSSKITAFEYPRYFKDEMISGPFQMINHDHYFEAENGRTVMKERFEFKSPFGLCGRLCDKVLMSTYMKNLILRRNKVIKEYAESDKWKQILSR